MINDYYLPLRDRDTIDKTVAQWVVFIAATGLSRSVDIAQDDHLAFPEHRLNPRRIQVYCLTKPGKSTKPLHLPTKAPPCFDSQKQWNQYREVAVYSAGNGFTHCSDCTPERRDKMVNQERCRWPGTTFSRPNGVIVGRRKK